MKSSISSCSVLALRTYGETNGSLCTVEPFKDVPHAVERVFYLFDIRSGSQRSRHAHRILHQSLVALNGSFDVLIDDGAARRRITLNRSHIALHIPPLIWTSLENFSSGAVCLVLASAAYCDADYIRDYDEFLKLRGLSR